MEYKEISAKDNNVIKEYKKASTSRKFRKENNLFTLEGKRLILDAYKNKISFKRLLITNQALEKYYDDIKLMLDANNKNILKIADSLGEYLSDTENTQGIFALCKKPETPNEEEIFSGDKKNIIILETLQDPGNLGTILRTADAFGIDSVILHNSCDVFSPKVVRAAMGAVFRVKAIIMQPDEIFEKCTEYGIKTYATVLSNSATYLDKDTFSSSKNALFIGNEGNGLPDELSQKCDFQVKINMSGNAESLNAAMAAGIFMWEMTKEA